MKKITLLFLFLIMTFSVKAQFPEGFDNGLPSGWTTFIGTNGLGTAQNWALAGTTNLFMKCSDENAGAVTEDWLVSSSTSITATNSLLSFYEQTIYTQPFEPASMSVRVSATSQTDISTFTSLSSLSATEVFNGTNSRNVDLSAYEGESIYIAWVLEQEYGDGWIVDDIILSNQNADAPRVAENLSPINGATDVIMNASDGAIALSWDASTLGDRPTGYEIFWGTTSGSLTSLGTLPGTAVNITGNNYATRYYWMVVPLNIGGSATGSIEMSLTTQSNPSLARKDNTIAGLSLFPTVVKQELNFTSQNRVSEITISNLLGQQVYSDRPNIANSYVDISFLKSGIYLVNVKVGEAEGTYKIVKQ
jgi:hypothetical protein